MRRVVFVYLGTIVWMAVAALWAWRGDPIVRSTITLGLDRFGGRTFCLMTQKLDISCLSLRHQTVWLNPSAALHHNQMFLVAREASPWTALWNGSYLINQMKFF